MSGNALHLYGPSQGKTGFMAKEQKQQHPLMK
jgi:hypothetical protein